MVTLFAPVQAIIFGIAALVAYSFWSTQWFAYHPMFMLLAYLGFMSNAIFFERWGSNHWLHLVLQLMCVACADFAWYVIYSNKNMANKAHFTTWHAWIGVACLVMSNLQCFGSMYTLWPATPRSKIKSLDITLHKWGGRGLFIAILVTLHLGFYKMRSYNVAQMVAFDAFLVSVAVVCLTKLVYIRPLWSKIRL